MRRENGLAALGALNPSTIQVDERTVLDRLSFVANFGKLINFYDKSNQKNGSWRPFFLKDPAILLAAVSQTDYTSKHMLFLMLSKKLNASNLTVTQTTKDAQSDEQRQYNALVEQLFDLIQSIFADFNDWFEKMENTQKTYQLKEFVKQNIPSLLAPLLWQFVSLRQSVALVCQGVSSPNYQLFENFQPLWQMTNSRTTSKLTTDTKVFLQLQAIYHPVFSFYMQVINAAKDTFHELKENLNNPPDTALLIAFVELMEVHRQQLNKMTQQHLDFYYRNILKQNNKPAKPDEAFLSLTLAQNTASFYLPVDTQFNAGLNEQQQPVIYANTKPQMLNHATIKQAITLCYCFDEGFNADKDFKKLYKNVIKTPTQLTKTSSGDLQSWALLGNAKGIVTQQGFAFASPLLSLQSGLRHITITFSFTKNYTFDLDFIQNSKAYLSTKKDWFKTTFKVSQPNSEQLQLLITLQSTDPAITAFTKNPDGFSSTWSLFKLMLSDCVNLSAPPPLKNVEIITQVEQFSSFELYNDFGKLANSGFSPFGSIPAQGNNFYLGSTELFAKPLTELELQFNWDGLPVSMDSYYLQYNEFLSQQNTDKPPFAFNNQCFKVIFSMWENNQWQKVLIDNAETQTPQNKQSDTVIIEDDNLYWISLFNTELPEPKPSVSVASVKQNKVAPKPYGLKKLFGFGKVPPAEPTPEPPPAQPVLISNSHFLFENADFNNLTPAPYLLLQPLDFTTAVKQGFLNISLQQPIYGFGNSLYAQVVADVSQQNTYQLIKALGSDSYSTKPLPNPPYVPKVSKFSVNYSARQFVDFSIVQNYPFEYFYYDSFSCHQVYNSTASSDASTVVSIQSPGINDGTLKLFAGINASSCLYLCLDKVEPPCNLSLYIELAHLIALLDEDIAPTVSFYYLSKVDWQPLKILADGTNQLSCSGILEVFISQDICPNNSLMPEDGYWLAIASNNPTTDFANVLYLNTQAIKVKRISTTQASKQDANKITMAATPLPQIDTINQPFASFNGIAQENDTTFYQRVSQRIKTKDRASNLSDFENMALEALQGLYFCKLVVDSSNTQNLGEISLGLVNGYESPMLPDAYCPVVSLCDIDKIRRYFSSKISPFVQLKLFNLSHEIVTIEAELKFTNTAQVNFLCQQIAQQLKIYLSPWIQSELPQIIIDEELTDTAIIDYLSSFPEVEGVSLLKISTHLQPNPTSPITPKAFNGLFISATTHEIRAAI